MNFQKSDIVPIVDIKSWMHCALYQYRKSFIRNFIVMIYIIAGRLDFALLK